MRNKLYIYVIPEYRVPCVVSVEIPKIGTYTM
jgi:hypothetical protein